MIKVLVFLALLVPSIVFASTVNISWSPVTQLENGDPVEGVEYLVTTEDGVELYRGTETSFSLSLEETTTILIYSVVGELRSDPLRINMSHVIKRPKAVGK